MIFTQHRCNTARRKLYIILYILGYDRSIPGIPRYAVLGSEESDNFSLQISNVTLEDDDDYECQVGPANYNKPIRREAHLTVQGIQILTL